MRRVRIRNDLVVDLDKFDAFKCQSNDLGDFDVIGRNARNEENVSIAIFEYETEAQEFLAKLADTDLRGAAR